MAKRLETFEFKQKRTSKYLWHEWGNGDIWQLTRGEDFEASTTSLRNTIHKQANSMGLKARVRVVDEDTVVTQFYKPDGS